MKSVVLAAAMAAIVVLALAGCGGGSAPVPVEGSWRGEVHVASRVSRGGPGSDGNETLAATMQFVVAPGGAVSGTATDNGGVMSWNLEGTMSHSRLVIDFHKPTTRGGASEEMCLEARLFSLGDGFAGPGDWSGNTVEVRLTRS